MGVAAVATKFSCLSLGAFDILSGRAIIAGVVDVVDEVEEWVGGEGYTRLGGTNLTIKYVKNNYYKNEKVIVFGA